MLTAGAANLLIANASDEQVETWVKPMVEGAFTAPCAFPRPRPAAPSRTSPPAVPRDDGTYRIFGNKMWISGGSHELGDNIVPHLVLAKIPGSPPGEGISLFIVPRFLLDQDGSIGEQKRREMWPVSTTRWVSAGPSTRSSASRGRVQTGRQKPARWAT